MPRDNFFYYFGMVMQLGLTIVITIIIGLGIGMALDKAFKMKGPFTILFLMIGIGSGFMNAYKDIMGKKR